MSEVNGNFFCQGCKEEVKIKYSRQKNEIKYGPIVEWKSINNEWSFLDVSGVWGNYKYIERWNDYKFWYCCECGCCYSEYYESRPTGFEIREHGNKNN